MITVSSCGVKPQRVLSGLERKAEILDIHMHFCGFSFIHSLQHFFFLSTWGVIFILFFYFFCFLLHFSYAISDLSMQLCPYLVVESVHYQIIAHLSVQIKLVKV